MRLAPSCFPTPGRAAGNGRLLLLLLPASVCDPRALSAAAAAAGQCAAAPEGPAAG